MSGLSLVAVVVAFMQAVSSPSWPASAGAQPKASPTKFKDPGAGYFDPPRGRYRLPDGTIREADPPRGFYDPPPGRYAVAPPGLRRPLPNAVIGPLPTAEGSAQAWLDRRHRLRIGLGVSLGVAGVGAVIPLVGLALQRGDEPCVDCFAPGTLIALYVVPTGLISAIALGITLAVHNRRRPQPSRVQVFAGGLRMSF